MRRQDCLMQRLCVRAITRLQQPPKLGFQYLIERITQEVPARICASVHRRHTLAPVEVATVGSRWRRVFQIGFRDTMLGLGVLEDD